MSKLAIVAVSLLAVLDGGRVFAEEAISEPRCLCGLSTGAEVLKAALPIFPDSANAPANERDSGINDRARTQTLSRHHRHGSEPLRQVVNARIS